MIAFIQFIGKADRDNIIIYSEIVGSEVGYRFERKAVAGDTFFVCGFKRIEAG